MEILLDEIFSLLDSRVASEIHGISISAFLQLVDTEKKTCTLTVKSNGNTGYLYISSGELIAAEAGELRAEEAAHQIINWERTVIEIENSCRRKKREIHQPLMMVLMESARMKDEGIS
jgi:hypothetical protein